MKKSGLIVAHVMLQCRNAKHEGTCAELCDTLVNRFNEVKEAHTITQITGKSDFCVSGTAKINPYKKDLFTDALRTLLTDSDNNSMVKDVRVYLEAD